MRVVVSKSWFGRLGVLTGLACLAAAWLDVVGPGAAWLGFGLLLAALAAFLRGVFDLGWGFFLPALTHGAPEGNEIALTFDDGPDPELTPRVLEALARHQARACFFVIGRQVEQNPDLTRRIVAEGHLIANHSYSHPWCVNFFTSARLEAEIRECQAAIRRATGLTPAFYRPPMGQTSPSLARALERTGLTAVGWSARGFDTRWSAPRARRRILAQVSAGGVVLLHDSPAGRGLADSLAALLEEIEARGFAFTRLDALLHRPAYQGGVA